MSNESPFSRSVHCTVRSWIRKIHIVKFIVATENRKYFSNKINGRWLRVNDGISYVVLQLNLTISWAGPGWQSTLGTLPTNFKAWSVKLYHGYFGFLEHSLLCTPPETITPKMIVRASRKKFIFNWSYSVGQQFDCLLHCYKNDWNTSNAHETYICFRLFLFLCSYTQNFVEVISEQVSE